MSDAISTNPLKDLTASLLLLINPWVFQFAKSLRDKSVIPIRNMVASEKCLPEITRCRKQQEQSLPWPILCSKTFSASELF